MLFYSSAPDTTFFCDNGATCFSGPHKELTNIGDNRYNCFKCDYDQCAICVSHLAQREERLRTQREEREAREQLTREQQEEKLGPPKDPPPYSVAAPPYETAVSGAAPRYLSMNPGPSAPAGALPYPLNPSAPSSDNSSGAKGGPLEAPYPLKNTEVVLEMTPSAPSDDGQRPAPDNPFAGVNKPADL